MTDPGRISLEIDQEVGAAYLRFTENSVDRTVEFDDDINVDLDEHGVVVGFELLDLQKSIPLDQLTDEFHVRAELLAVLLQSVRATTKNNSAGTYSQEPEPFGSIRTQDVTDLTNV